MSEHWCGDAVELGPQLLDVIYAMNILFDCFLNFFYVKSVVVCLLNNEE